MDLIPLEQNLAALTVVFRCEDDGVIDSKDLIDLDGEVCCPFCCKEIEIEFYQGSIQVEEPDVLTISRVH